MIIILIRFCTSHLPVIMQIGDPRWYTRGQKLHWNFKPLSHRLSRLKFCYCRWKSNEEDNDPAYLLISLQYPLSGTEENMSGRQEWAKFKPRSSPRFVSKVSDRNYYTPGQVGRRERKKVSKQMPHYVFYTKQLRLYKIYRYIEKAVINFLLTNIFDCTILEDLKETRLNKAKACKSELKEKIY